MVDVASNSTKETVVSELNNQYKINIEPEDYSYSSLIKANTNTLYLSNGIPELKFRDIIIAKKFGTDYDTDRYMFILILQSIKMKKKRQKQI